MDTGRSRARPSAGRRPRAAALAAIRRVVEGSAYSNLVVPAELDRAGLSGRDRAFASDLAYGTIRRLIPIDAALGLASNRSLDDVDPEALALLRLGAYQLLFSRVPAHAAVSETVALAGPRHRGFVNAVLRHVRPASSPGDTDAAISLRTGLAEWAVAELRRLLPSQVESAAAALASPAHATLRVNTCRTDRDSLRTEIERRGHPVEAGRFHPDVLRAPGAMPAGIPGYREGLFGVQDEASVLVGAAVQAGPGERILDACAGPGGKAAHLACQVSSGGLVVAADVHLRRAGLVRSTAVRLGVGMRIVVQDARRPALRGGFDAILVDAPCSGLGAARRRPELLWRQSKTDLARLARLQVAILAGAAPLVRPGGRLVYSVCTFPRAETDAAVRAFVNRCPEFELAGVPGADGMAPVHRLWPHRHDTDAMFYAGFVRRSGRTGDTDR